MINFLRIKSLRLTRHLNFYRIHILFFTFTPLFFSAVFYGSNGQFPISYIDSLFLCVSAMTVCGLASVDLSTLTTWQQTILFIQMCLGSPVVVSWFMVYIRRYYFAKELQPMFAEKAAVGAAQHAKQDGKNTSIPSEPWYRRFFTRHSGESTVDGDSDNSRAHTPTKAPKLITRVDEPPRRIDPGGAVSQGDEIPSQVSILHHGALVHTPEPESRSAFMDDAFVRKLGHRSETLQPDSPRSPHPRRLSDPGTMSPRSGSPIANLQREYVHDSSLKPQGTGALPRTASVGFAPTPTTVRRARAGSTVRGRLEVMTESEDRDLAERSTSDDRRSRRGSFHTHPTIQTQASIAPPVRRRSKHSGFGGFPMPHNIVKTGLARFFPNLERRITRTMTIPRTMTYASTATAPYLSFPVTVGPNSNFSGVTSEQYQELAGVEYSALNALLWIVGIYHFSIQIFAYVVIAPYMARGRWAASFLEPLQQRDIASPWFSLFQVVSSYTNTGMSLVDQSMLPFQNAYPMVFFMAFLILAGNTAFPILLRFIIWALTKVVKEDSKTWRTLHFLLDHPRRCFIYLFPSHQTWFLLTVVISLTCIDWFCFLILDIGTPAIEAIPVGIRVASGFLQAVAVRAAGFGVVPLAALAPAVKVLYVVMMYISVYPIAMSVRSTNVYEEQSLGVFTGEEQETDDNFQTSGGRVAVWSRYLAMHARQQLAFDMWWLGMALFLVCIIERGHLNDPAKQSWFSIFNVLFELVSAYGTVGLSLGLPTQNYSFSGVFKPLSKVIVCLVMLRGRHRGLPVAIDRAIMLPSKKDKVDSDNESIEPTPTPAGRQIPPPFEDGPWTYDMNGNQIREKPQRPETDDLRRRTRMDSLRSDGTDGNRRALVEAKA